MGSTVGNTLQKITDYKAIIQDKVLEQYKGKPNWDKMLTLISSGFTELENVFWDLYIKRWLESSEGTQLDNLGYNLTVERQGLADGDYRQIIYAKIGQYNSNGRIEDILSIARLMTNAEQVYLNEQFPASMSLTIIGDSLNINEEFLQSSLKQATAGGVGLSVVTSGKTPVFVYGKENGSVLPPFFSGYPAEDGSTESFYAETV